MSARNMVPGNLPGLFRPANDFESLLIAEVAALRARLTEVLEAGERFLAVADDVAKTAEVRWHRTQKALGAAALSRAGKIEEGRAIVAELDRSPTVWDFGRTVDDLAEAAAAWRRAARRGTP